MSEGSGSLDFTATTRKQRDLHRRIPLGMTLTFEKFRLKLIRDCCDFACADRREKCTSNVLNPPPQPGYTTLSICPSSTAPGCGHTVQPPTEWDGRTDGRIEVLLYATSAVGRGGHNNSVADCDRQAKGTCSIEGAQRVHISAK